MNSEWWDVARVLNVFVSIIVVAMLMAGAVQRWDEMPLRFKRITPWVIGTYVVIAYGSGEALANNVEPGYRIILMLADLLGLAAALVYRMTETGYSRGSILAELRSVFQREDNGKA